MRGEGLESIRWQFALARKEIRGGCSGGRGGDLEMEALRERAYAPLTVLLPQLLGYYCVELHELRRISKDE